MTQKANKNIQEIQFVILILFLSVYVATFVGTIVYSIHAESVTSPSRAIAPRGV